MLLNVQIFKKYTTVLLTILAIAASVSFAAPANSRKELRPQSSSEAQRGISDRLGQILEMVNTNHAPSEDFLENSTLFLKGCRPYLKQLKPEDICEYYTLNAWISHYSNDDSNAYLAAQKAHTTNPSNQDAKATYTALAFIVNKEPIIKQSRNKSNNYNKNTLEFNESALRPDLTGRAIPPLKVNCLNSTTFTYEPGQGALAVLFWSEDIKAPQIPADAGPVDPNAPGIDPNTLPKPVQNNIPLPKRPMTGEMEFEGRNNFGHRGSSDTDYTPTSTSDSFHAFNELARANITNPQLKFIAVNTNQIEQLPGVINILSTTPGLWANTMAKLQKSNITEIADINTDSSVLVIADKSGKVIYAGSPVGFMPKLILQSVGGMTSDAINQPGTMTPTPAKPVSKNKPAERPQPKPTPKRHTAKDKLEESDQPQLRTLPLEEQLQADKKLTYARELFVPASRKHMLSPTRGVEMCRDLMKSYPNTKYYYEAQTLLREGVPERYRERYHLTDEELGITDENKDQ